MSVKPSNGGDRWGSGISQRPLPRIFCKSKSTLAMVDTRQELTCLNLLPCLHLLPENRPTRGFSAREFTPADTFQPPWHPCVCVRTRFDPWLLCFTTTHVSRDASQTLGSRPCRAGRLALKVKSFIADQGKHEIGVGVLGNWLIRYYRHSISSDVQKQLDGVHSHR